MATGLRWPRRRLRLSCAFALYCMKDQKRDCIDEDALYPLISPMAMINGF
jgi:hypothetical protein